VIFGVAIHLPQIVKLGLGKDIIHALHRCHHGVILVVLLVHTVTSNQVKVGISRLQLLANGSDAACVIIIINRISFLLTNDAAIDEIAFPG